jgi:hypothetical protein
VLIFYGCCTHRALSLAATFVDVGSPTLGVLSRVVGFKVPVKARSETSPVDE